MTRFNRLLAVLLTLCVAGPFGVMAASAPPFTPGVDLSVNPITVPGGAARGIAQILGDQIDILNDLPQATASTDFTVALNRRLATGARIRLPNTGLPYQISGTLTLPAGAALLCDPGTVIQQTTAGKQTLNVTGAGARVDACLVSGGGIGGVVGAPNFTWIGGGADSTGGLYIRSDHVRVERTAWTKTAGTAISIDSAADTDFQIIDNEFEQNVGFGVWATNGASNGLISGNWTNSNGIELVGITYSAHHIRITDNYAHGTGDNCFSISGYDNTATGNIANGCAYTGIYVYGDQNLVVGNTSLDNGQVHNPTFATLVGPSLTAGNGYSSSNANNYPGINATGNYGGGGQENVIVGNFTDDDQTTKTQAFDIVTGVNYGTWAASTAYASGAYVYSNGATWQATAAGTSGSTAPSGTANVSDGSITWKYLKTLPIATREAAGNTIIGNVTYRYATAAYNDTTVNHNNTIITDGNFTFGSASSGLLNTVQGGFAKKTATNWASGATYVAGQIVYANSGSNLYRVVAPGAGTT